MPYLFQPGRVAGTREQVVHPNDIVVCRVGTGQNIGRNTEGAVRHAASAAKRLVL
jgi:hypothetical protein